MTYPNSYIIICGNFDTGLSDNDYQIKEQYEEYIDNMQKINEIISKYNFIDIYRNTHQRNKIFLNAENTKFCHFIIDKKIADKFLFINTDISEKTVFNNKYIILELQDI